MQGIEDDDDSKNTDDITFSAQTGPAWAGSERDYTYDEVSTRMTVLWNMSTSGLTNDVTVCPNRRFI